MALAHRRLGRVGETRARACQAFVGREGRVEPHDRELVECGREEEEALELDPGRGLGRLHEQRCARAEDDAERHREALADVVDRRVRHLREALPKVAVERAGAAGEQRERGVVAIDEVGSCACAAVGRSTTESSSRV